MHAQTKSRFLLERRTERDCWFRFSKKRNNRVAELKENELTHMMTSTVLVLRVGFVRAILCACAFVGASLVRVQFQDDANWGLNV